MTPPLQRITTRAAQANHSSIKTHQLSNALKKQVQV